MKLHTTAEVVALAHAFGLEHAPRRVEIYDNSHIMGTNAVGGMVVAGRMGFSKPHYRTFNIKSEELTPGDDFGMMREVLTRRLTRLLKEATPPVPPKLADGGELAETMSGDESEAETGGAGVMPLWPDLILIDGGQGQRNFHLFVGIGGNS